MKPGPRRPTTRTDHRGVFAVKDKTRANRPPTSSDHLAEGVRS